MMLDRKEVNAVVEKLVRQHWSTDLTWMEQTLQRLTLIEELKAFMDQTVETALKEGSSG